jgi:hypothetical protein
MVLMPARYPSRLRQPVAARLPFAGAVLYGTAMTRRWFLAMADRVSQGDAHHSEGFSHARRNPQKAHSPSTRSVRSLRMAVSWRLAPRGTYEPADDGLGLGR